MDTCAVITKMHTNRNLYIFWKLKTIPSFLWNRGIKNAFFIFQFLGGSVTAQVTEAALKSVTSSMFFTWPKLGKKMPSILSENQKYIGIQSVRILLMV